MICKPCGFALLLATVLAACSPSPTPTPPDPHPGPAPTPAPSPTAAPSATTASPTGPFSPAATADLASLVRSTNTFTTDLYAKLARGEGNLAASPASISLALAMAYAGAGGETAAQMRSSLRLSLDADASHRAFGTMLRGWQPKPRQRFALSVANRLFGSDKLAIRDAYRAVTKDYYAAPLETLDFAGAAEPSRQRINAWVAEQTNDKIVDLLPGGAIRADTQLVVANAIYFKARWAYPFVEKDTAAETFHAPSGDIQVQMMHQQKHLRYAEADGMKLLEMAYVGGAMAMTFLLPDANDGLSALEGKITADNLNRWMDGANARHKVRVALPRFKIKPAEPVKLSRTLAEMGMPLAFDRARADFRGIAEPSGPNLYIDELFHKAFVEVDENGTEAAAATGAVMFPTSMPMPSEPKDFIADHPFVFMIRDARNGAILFIGRVVKP